MNKEQVKTENAPKAIGAYSQGIKIYAEKTFYFSGQIAINPASGKIEKTDIEGQTAVVLQNISALLESQKLNQSNIVKTTIFLTDIKSFPSVNALYAAFIGTDTPPARSCVAVSALPMNALVEIEVIAAK